MLNKYLKIFLLFFITSMVLCGCDKNKLESKQELVCEDGFELVDSKCTKYTYVSDAMKKQYCDASYTLQGIDCVKTSEVQPTVNYSCKEGYTLENNNCVKTEKKEATKHFSCPSTYSYKNNECIRKIEYPVQVKYSCPNSDYHKYGSSCVYDYSVPAQSVNGRYICTSSGCTLIGNRCECSRTVPASETPYCTKGEYSNGKCVLIEKEAILRTYYLCESGLTLSGTQCIKKTSILAQKQYKCNSGYTLKNGVCTKVIDKKNTNSAYYCNDNLKLKDEKCYNVEITEPIPQEKTIKK